MVGIFMLCYRFKVFDCCVCVGGGFSVRFLSW